MTHPVPDAPLRPSPDVVASVRRSLVAVSSQPVILAERFYAYLFEMAPSVRSMFAPDMTQQMQKMTETLLMAIGQLDEPDTSVLEKALRGLGADHAVKYGVVPAHYHYIGHALTRAVREVAGPAYDGYMSSSWISLYRWVAWHMTAGADAATNPAVPPQAPPVELPAPRVTSDTTSRDTSSRDTAGRDTARDTATASIRRTR
jgi:hemoglobin-like flavoprotein